MGENQFRNKIAENTKNPLKYFLTCYRINLLEKGNNKQKCKKHT